MTSTQSVADVRRDPPIRKGKLTGVPIQSHSDLISRLDWINSTARGWPKSPAYAHLIPEMKDRIRQTAESALLRSFLDFDEGREWTQSLMPRSGRWKIAFPIRDSGGSIFMRKVPINWDGAIEVESTEGSSDLAGGVAVPEFDLLFDEDTGIAMLDMLYVAPLTTAERDRRFEEEGTPEWVDLRVHREFGVDHLGNLFTFDPHG